MLLSVVSYLWTTIGSLYASPIPKLGMKLPFLLGARASLKAAQSSKGGLSPSRKGLFCYPEVPFITSEEGNHCKEGLFGKGAGLWGAQVFPITMMGGRLLCQAVHNLCCIECHDKYKENWTWCIAGMTMTNHRSFQIDTLRRMHCIFEGRWAIWSFFVDFSAGMVPTKSN